METGRTFFWRLIKLDYEVLIYGVFISKYLINWLGYEDIFAGLGIQRKEFFFISLLFGRGFEPLF